MIDICICTYRRTSLAMTLQSLATQTNISDCRVIIADNDLEPSARDLVERIRAKYPAPVIYLHAPAKNISIARNACLEATSAPLVAFIDDDLVASKTWLSALINKQAGTGADAVFGPVQAEYPPSSPGWLRAADLHSIKPVFVNGEIETGYTCNVLMRRELAKSAQFDPQLGSSGGEDTIFFYQAWRSGARFAYAPEAVIHEQVETSRLNLNWLLKRSFRSGQSYARILQSRMSERKLALVPAGVKFFWCCLTAALTFPIAHLWRKNLVRGALHLGSFSKLISFSDLKIYR